MPPHRRQNRNSEGARSAGAAARIPSPAERIDRTGHQRAGAGAGREQSGATASAGPNRTGPSRTAERRQARNRARPNEIDTLIRRGKNLLNDGDFAAARVLFERAASADAALALGSTYDPNVIKRLGAIMVKPDLEKARQWYQVAADRGSAAASLQLANLPQSR